MKSLYCRLAIDNMHKNRRLYVPYMLTGCAMVAIVYILGVIGHDPGVLALPDKDVVRTLMNAGALVMGLFAAIFLLYTNAFLIRQRSRELGLYNVLGMTKGNILCIVFWETLFCALAAIVSGLAIGVLLSKLSALALVKMLGGEPSSASSVPALQLSITAVGFALLYGLIFLCSMFNVLRVHPLELMRQAQFGEKPPRGNLLIALTGVMLLLSGYALALHVKNPRDVLGTFFIAVLLVILSTFVCFRSASVYIPQSAPTQQAILSSGESLHLHLQHGIPHETLRRQPRDNLHTAHHGSDHAVHDDMHGLWHR